MAGLARKHCIWKFSMLALTNIFDYKIENKKALSAKVLNCKKFYRNTFKIKLQVKLKNECFNLKYSKV